MANTDWNKVLQLLMVEEKARNLPIAKGLYDEAIDELREMAKEILEEKAKEAEKKESSLWGQDQEEVRRRV